MATRIHPRPAPAEPASPRLEPNAEMLLAPPPNLSKRLTAAVHRRLPGWTVQVVVKRWTEEHVKVVVTGQRDADALAPPAPPPGSAQAEKLASSALRALERSVEQTWPDADLSFSYEYTSDNADQLTLRLAGNKNDPPTCIDGRGEVVFPGDARLVKTNEVTVTNTSDVDRWVYLHWPLTGSTTPASPPAPLGPTPVQASYVSGSWLQPPGTPLINPPALTHPIPPTIPDDNKTFAYLVSAGGGSLTLAVNNQLANWWVWW